MEGQSVPAQYLDRVGRSRSDRGSVPLGPEPPLPAMTVQLEEAVAHWRAAENRLYPVVMTRPDLYERSVRIVRAVADDLRSARDPQALLKAYERAADIVTDVVRRLEIPSEEIDMGLVTGAAFSLRYRELLEEM